jgi:hypothetical protein
MLPKQGAEYMRRHPDCLAEVEQGSEVGCHSAGAARTASRSSTGGNTTMHAPEGMLNARRCLP